MRYRVVERQFMETAGKVCFTWMLPCRIFLDTCSSDSGDKNAYPMLGFVFAATIITFVVIWLIAAKTVHQESRGAFVHASFRSSFTVLGLSVIRNMYGSKGVARCAGLLALIVVLYNVLAVICLAPRGKKGVPPSLNILSTLKTIFTNPLIIAVMAAALLNYSHISLPTFIIRPIEYLSDASLPLSLLCIGAALDLSKVKGHLGGSFLASAIKTCLMAVVVIPAAVILGFRSIDLSAIAILFTTGNPSACYVMTVSMGGDGELVATSVVLSTLMSIFTVTLVIYTLRALSFI